MLTTNGYSFRDKRYYKDLNNLNWHQEVHFFLLPNQASKLSYGNKAQNWLLVLWLPYSNHYLVKKKKRILRLLKEKQKLLLFSSTYEKWSRNKKLKCCVKNGKMTMVFFVCEVNSRVWCYVCEKLKSSDVY